MKTALFPGMKKIYFILLVLLLEANCAFSDDVYIQRFDVNPQLRFKGTIGDKYSITMYLNLYGDSTCYGKYKYDRTGRGFLVLFGKFIYSDFLIYEYEKDVNTGIFKGRLDRDEVAGIWSNQTKDEKLPFRLHLTQGTLDNHGNRFLPKNLFLIMVGKSDKEHAFLDLSKEIVNSIHFYKVYFSTEENGSHYLIFFTEGGSRGEGCRSGMCGCGIESHLVWAALNDTYDIIGRNVVCLRSCINSVNVCSKKEIEEFFASDKSELDLVGFDARNNSYFAVKFNKRHPENGLEVKEINKSEAEDR